MLSTQLNKFEEHIYKSIEPVYVQPGKVYFFGKYTRGDKYSKEYKEARILSDNYDIVEILSVTVKPNWDKLKVCLENNNFPSIRTYRDYDKDRNTSFGEYYKKTDGLSLFHSGIFGNDHGERGLLWDFKVRSLRNGNVYTIENYGEMTNECWGSPKNYTNTFYTLDCCEYEGHYKTIQVETGETKEEVAYDSRGRAKVYHTRKVKNVVSTNFADFDLDKNAEAIKTIDSFKNELRERINDNYRFIWAILRKNAKKVSKHNTIVVDGTEFAQGLLFHQGRNREYCGAAYIPAGYRLPTKDELDKLVVKHRMLPKRSATDTENKLMSFRNNAGWEYSITRSEFGYSNYRQYQFVYMLQNNDINNPDYYFADVMDMYVLNARTMFNDSCSRGIVFDDYCYAAAAGEDREWYHSGLYVLVKMTDEELKAEKNLIKEIFNSHKINKTTLLDFYKPFGLQSFEDIQSIDFSLSYKNAQYTNEGKVDDTFHREAISDKMDILKKAIADVFADKKIFDASKIKISFDGNELVVDNNVEVNMETMLFNLSPMLCRKACKCNYMPLKYGIKKDSYYYSKSYLEKFYQWSDYLDMTLLDEKINLHMFSRAARRGLSVSTGGTTSKYGGWSESALDLYITNLKLNMKDGTSITIPENSFSYQDLIFSGLYSKYEAVDDDEKSYMKSLKDFAEE